MRSRGCAGLLCELALVLFVLLGGEAVVDLLVLNLEERVVQVLARLQTTTRARLYRVRETSKRAWQIGAKRARALSHACMCTWGYYACMSHTDMHTHVHHEYPHAQTGTHAHAPTSIRTCTSGACVHAHVNTHANSSAHLCMQARPSALKLRTLKKHGRPASTGSAPNVESSASVNPWSEVQV
eukprot:6194324-Pleurochrysis_carterae.AAC.1